MKTTQYQRPAPRTPVQERSRFKVRLILEATIRQLEKNGIEGLNTNAIAAGAGVSIGTLYQFFPNKAAILDALADREMAEMSARVLAVMQDGTIATTRERVAAVVRTVTASYGERHSAHRLVMAHSLARGGGNRLAPLLLGLREHLMRERAAGPITAPLAPAQAFVLTHAFNGVLRAMIRDGEDAPPQAEIEQALADLVVRFAG